MASLQASPIYIDYSVPDGRVREFSLGDLTLYDEKTGIMARGWKETLALELVKSGLLAQGLNHQAGPWAFVWWLRDQGMFPFLKGVKP